MLQRWRRRGGLHWAICFALVLATLAPAVSQAVQAARGELAPWSVICSAGAEGRAASGDRADDRVDGSIDDRADLAHLFLHCPFCATAQPLLGLPPAAPAVLPASAPVHELPALFLAAPRPLFAWAAAQPRGPPRPA